MTSIARILVNRDSAIANPIALPRASPQRLTKMVHLAPSNRNGMFFRTRSKRNGDMSPMEQIENLVPHKIDGTVFGNHVLNFARRFHGANDLVQELTECRITLSVSDPDWKRYIRI